MAKQEPKEEPKSGPDLEANRAAHDEWARLNGNQPPAPEETTSRKPTPVAEDLPTGARSHPV